MRTITPGAARRRETSEAVRERMANLFEVAMRAEPVKPDPSSDRGPSHADGTSALDSPSDTFGPAAPDPPPPRRRLLPGLHPGLMLDRRALLGLAVLLLLAVGYAAQHFWLGRPHPVAVPSVTAVADPSATAAATAAISDAASARGPGPTASAVVIDVAGKVQHPGLRTLPTGSRVADALHAAGGPLEGTDTDTLNLARLLTDGEQILVGAPPGQAAATTPAIPLNLNQASAEQLDALPGVGPTLAQRIVQYRQQHGLFRSLDQLRRISGIGERKYQDIRPLLTL